MEKRQNTKKTFKKMDDHAKKTLEQFLNGLKMADDMQVECRGALAGPIKENKND